MSKTVAKPGIGHNVPPASASTQAKREEAAYYDDGLLAVAGRIMILCYAGALTITSFTFFASGEALYVVAISIAFALMYFTLPVIMGRVRAARDHRWRSDSAHKTSAMVDLWTGPVRRREAIMQIISIPVAVLFAYAAFSAIWTLTA